MFLRLAVALLSSSLLISCAHNGIVSKRNIESDFFDSENKTVHVSENQIKSDIEKISLNREGGEEIPVEVNVLVTKWLEYFQGRGRKHMEKYLARSSKYMPLMKETLVKEGLPEDLVYIALIESGFSPVAKSHAGAVGYWQFIRSTGKAYGLKINSHIDERRDFVKSSYAAAKYFKALYSLFGDWYLSMAAYNAGENRIKGSVMRNKTRDFWQLAKMKKLPKETINYVPKFLAATLIAKEPKRYGFSDIEYLQPVQFEEIKYNQNVNLKTLAEKIAVPYEDLRLLNPSFRSEYAVQGREDYVLVRVPAGYLVSAQEHIESSVVAQLPQNIVDPSDKDLMRYKIKPNDTLGGIARKFRTSVAELRTINDLGKRAVIRAGRYIKVPARDEARKVASDRKNNSSKVKTSKSNNMASKSSSQKSKTRFHRVKSGENLNLVANKYNTSVKRLLAVNNLKSKSKILAGSRLIIPD